MKKVGGLEFIAGEIHRVLGAETCEFGNDCTDAPGIIGDRSDNSRSRSEGIGDSGRQVSRVGRAVIDHCDLPCADGLGHVVRSPNSETLVRADDAMEHVPPLCGEISASSGCRDERDAASVEERSGNFNIARALRPNNGEYLR